MNYTKIRNVKLAQCPKGHLQVGQLGMSKYHGDIYWKCNVCGKLYNSKEFKVKTQTIMVPHRSKEVFK